MKQNYYVNKKQEASSIYDIWERGENYGDSVTPSTWSSAYRLMITEILCRYLPYKNASILSLGCGNATPEGELVSRGFNVFGLDLNREALNYANKKGVNIIESDFYEFVPELKFDLIYADGFFGHLCSMDQSARNIYQRIGNFFLNLGGVVVVSNDAPRIQNKHIQKHPSVPDFYFLSPQYLMNEAKISGFDNIEANIFFYKRPISGTCPRTIVVSKLL